MILVVWEAQVPQEHWAMLQQTYKDVQASRPEAIRQSWLVQNAHEPTLWSILALWDTGEAALADEQAPTAASAAHVFRVVGVTPRKTVSTVEAPMASLDLSNTP